MQKIGSGRYNTIRFDYIRDDNGGVYVQMLCHGNRQFYNMNDMRRYIDKIITREKKLERLKDLK